MRSLFSPAPKATLPIDAPPLALALLITLVASLASGIKIAPTPNQPVGNAHAHNDYEHERPFWDAYEAGFASFEADIHLSDGGLLVGHDPEDLRPERTLEALYLEPIATLCAKNDGYAYRDSSPITLLIDIKTEAESTYAALRPLLERYSKYFTAYREGAVVPGAVTAILSGNRPKATLASETERIAFHDGRLSDLMNELDPALTPLVSDNWANHFEWDGELAISDSDKRKLDELVDKTHRLGAKLRFWNIPDQSNVWAVLRDAEVDYINTDRLSDLSAFLRSSETSE